MGESNDGVHTHTYVNMVVTTKVLHALYHSFLCSKMLFRPSSLYSPSEHDATSVWVLRPFVDKNVKMLTRMLELYILYYKYDEIVREYKFNLE